MFLQKLDTFPLGKECADALGQIRDVIYETKGFSVVLNDIKN
jgi:hypothetical protein